VPLARQREPRALHREECGNHVAEHVAGCGVSHHCPITFEIALVIKNTAENQQVNEISEISELHELGERGMRELFEPQRWVHSGKPMIEGDELGVLPTGIDQMHQPAHFFKTKQKEQVRIPVTPEVPEPVRKRFIEPMRALCGA